MKKSSKQKNRLTIKTIKAASKGDVEALSIVFAQYERYILALSTVRVHDENGRTFMFVDEVLRRELETELLTKTVGFKFKKVNPKVPVNPGVPVV